MSVPIRQFACSRTHGSSARCISFHIDTLSFMVTRSCFTSHDKKIVIIAALSGLFSCAFSQTAPHAMNLPVCAEVIFQCGPCLKLRFRDALENLMEHSRHRHVGRRRLFSNWTTVHTHNTFSSRSFPFVSVSATSQLLRNSNAVTDGSTKTRFDHKGFERCQLCRLVDDMNFLFMLGSPQN